MAKKNRLQPGDQAPDGICLDINGQAQDLSEVWADGPVLLTFLRHFG